MNIDCMEHRCGNRIAVNLSVWISRAGITGGGVLRNLSASGAFVETALPLASLALVRIEIPRCSHAALPPADAWGIVVRQDATGFGIEWCDLAPRASPYEDATLSGS